MSEQRCVYVQIQKLSIVQEFASMKSDRWTGRGTGRWHADGKTEEQAGGQAEGQAGWLAVREGDGVVDRVRLQQLDGALQQTGRTDRQQAEHPQHRNMKFSVELQKQQQ